VLYYTYVAALVFELLGGWTITDPGKGVDVDHSSPSSSEVMNGCSYTATTPVCYSGIDKDDFTFLGGFA